MEIKRSGSVRVDLLGGTLDLWPINLIVPNVVTLNLATSLKARVKVKRINLDGIEIVSKDYDTTKTFKAEDFCAENFSSDFFGPLNFVAQILNHFAINKGLRVELESGSPPGAGLGGSSTMGIVLYAALSEFRMKSLRLEEQKQKAISIVGSLEARILDAGPTGYQDYYPALFGGVLALRPSPGEIEVEQLFSQAFKSVLEQRVTLVYSGETRNSGINNWEVYKAFFDKNKVVREGLEEIAKLSLEALEAIRGNDLDKVPELIAREGHIRKGLFPDITTPKMDTLFKSIKKEVPDLGLKVCGAGGGGCFMLIHPADKRPLVSKLVEKAKMDVLDFSIEPPL